MTRHKFCRPGSFFRQTGKNMIQWGNIKEEGTAFTLKDKLSILFICHGSILRSLEKACYINGFHRSNGAYYTTITPFAKEL